MIVKSKPLGSREISTVLNGITFYFSSERAKNKFIGSVDAYLCQQATSFYNRYHISATSEGWKRLFSIVWYNRMELSGFLISIEGQEYDSIEHIKSDVFFEDLLRA